MRSRIIQQPASSTACLMCGCTLASLNLPPLLLCEDARTFFLGYLMVYTRPNDRTDRFRLLVTFIYGQAKVTGQIQVTDKLRLLVRFTFVRRRKLSESKLVFTHSVHAVYSLRLRLLCMSDVTVSHRIDLVFVCCCGACLSTACPSDVHPMTSTVTDLLHECC